MNKFEELNKLFGEKETAEKLLSMNIEDAQMFLAGKNLEFSIDELQMIAMGIKAGLESSTDELSVEELDSVAGGKSAYEQQCYDAGKKGGQILRQVFNIGLQFVTSLW